MFATFCSGQVFYGPAVITVPKESTENFLASTMCVWAKVQMSPTLESAGTFHAVLSGLNCLVYVFQKNIQTAGIKVLATLSFAMMWTTVARALKISEPAIFWE